MRLRVLRRMATASSDAPGATMASMLDDSSSRKRATTSAVSTSIGRFSPMMPPNADVASAWIAFSSASADVAPKAKPLGVACLMTTAAGLSMKSRTLSSAADMSYTLHSDGSWPSNCEPVARLAKPGRGSVYSAPSWCGFSP